jgi:hypothetical protein
VVLATPWQQFREIPTEHWARNGLPRVVIDCWRAFDHLSGLDGVQYVRLGFGGVASQTTPMAYSAG